MLYFDAQDQFELRGRGTVYTGPCPRDLESNSQLVGERVSIRGSEFEIVGVERRALPWAPKKGDPIGLLVRPAPRA